ncbi:hypothetical protein DENSPDRAFT_768150 [Dentipellis sp. KUC8613]|nr:hypothetical protein DENSPDRAFT_768150 [Dentipellis sp. KUC8613]
MRFTTTASLFALATPFLVSAAPIKRDTDPNNLLVLKFATVLEQLETQFYMQGLQKFQASDFTNAGFASAQIPIEQLTAIGGDEATHTTILTTTLQSLGAQPISGCTFDFSSVLTDVPTMAAAARLVENVGVGAYLGAAHLLSDPTLLTAAASILTVEARHQSILNVLNNGQAIPQAFDLPLLPQEVLAIAGPFISGCDVGIPANPTLTVTNTGTVAAGTSLTFKSPALNGSTDGMFCQMLAGGMPFSLSLPIDNCVVPSGLQGPVAIFITSDDQPLNNNARDQATNGIVAGPTMAFIDQAEALGSIIHANSGSSGSNNAASSTQTISPAEASAIISSASSDSGASPTATATDSGASASGAASSAAPTDSAAAASASGAAPTDSAAAAASGSASAAAPSASGAPAAANNAQVVQTPGGPNLYTGPSPDGKIIVDGWTTIPASQVTGAASATAAAPSGSAAAPSGSAPASSASAPAASASGSP